LRILKMKLIIFKAHQLLLYCRNPSKEPISFWVPPNPP
jgi:hypothetical protein